MNGNDRAPETATTRVSVEGADMQMLAGVGDGNLVELGRATGTRVALRGDSLTITGDTDNGARAESIATAMVMAIKPEILQGIIDGVPMKRLGKPEEIGAACFYLASENASFMTCATLNINGGLYYQ